MTEIREIDGERVIVTEHDMMQSILPLPQSMEDELVDQLLAAAIREDRSRLLAESDYIFMPDYPADTDTLIIWRAYRQALRDIPAQEGFPHTVMWPQQPGGEARQ